MPTLLQLAQSYANPDSVNYKLAYLREQIGGADFGELAFADQVQLAMLGDTIIVGGYLKTELIEAKSIHAEHLAAGAVTADKLAAGAVTADKLTVTDLSAITGHFSDLYAGDLDGAHMRFYESSNNPFIEMFDSAELRVKMEKDRISWYKGSATPKARMIVGESPEGGGNFLSLLSDVADGGVLMGAIRGSAKSYIWVAQSDQFVRMQVPGSMFTLAETDNKATWSGCWTQHWGDFHIDNNLIVSKNLTKASGSFLIDHPLDPDNKNLVHSFIEGPRYDLLYRGEATLRRGTVTIDIDVDSNMTTGTFDALTQNARVVSLCNQTGYARLKPSAVENGMFTVTCEDPTSNDVFAWAVLAERADPYIYTDIYADKQGRLLTEHLKEVFTGDQAKNKNTTVTDELAGYKGHKIHQVAYDKKIEREREKEGERNGK